MIMKKIAEFIKQYVLSTSLFLLFGVLLKIGETVYFITSGEQMYMKFLNYTQTDKNFPENFRGKTENVYYDIHNSMNNVYHNILSLQLAQNQ